MSAYIVSDDHLNVLVSYFLSDISGEGLWLRLNDQHVYLNQSNAGILAYKLHRENIRSVNGRYDETYSDEIYKWQYIRSAKDTYSIAEIAGAIDCLEYQSCEHDDYFTTEAWEALCSMRKRLLRDYAERELDGETTWNIEKAKESEKVYL